MRVTDHLGAKGVVVKHSLHCLPHFNIAPVAEQSHHLRLNF